METLISLVRSSIPIEFAVSISAKAVEKVVRVAVMQEPSHLCVPVVS